MINPHHVEKTEMMKMQEKLDRSVSPEQLHEVLKLVADAIDLGNTTYLRMRLDTFLAESKL